MAVSKSAKQEGGLPWQATSNTGELKFFRTRREAREWLQVQNAKAEDTMGSLLPPAAPVDPFSHIVAESLETHTWVGKNQTTGRIEMLSKNSRGSILVNGIPCFGFQDGVNRFRQACYKSGSTVLEARPKK